MDEKPLSAPLASDSVMADWKAILEADIESDDGKDAKEFVDFYADFLKANPTFPGSHPEAAAFYDDLNAKAMWLALPYLSDRDGYALFESKLGAAMAMPALDLWEKTRQWLLNLPMESRDDARAKVNEALLKSTAQATKAPLKVGDAERPGTVANWVNYYRSAVGEGVPDPLKQSQFYFTDKTFNGVPPEEREDLKRLFSLVDRIWYSSFDAPGFEEDIVVQEPDGEVKDIYAGEEVKASPETLDLVKKVRRGASPEEERVRLAGILRGSEAEATEIAGFEDGYKAELGGDPAKIRDAIWKLLEPVPGKLPEPHRLVALLKQLARTGALDSLLRSDKRFFDALAQRYADGGESGKVDDLKVYPTSPAHVSAILELMLEEGGGLDGEDAARYAVQLANIMQRQGNDKYLGVAYLDEDTEEFRFEEPLKPVAAAAPAAPAV